MGEDHAALRRRRVTEADEFPQKIFIGQAVEAVPANARRLISARNGQDAGDPRHGAVEGGVEARNLGQLGMTFGDRLD